MADIQIDAKAFLKRTSAILSRWKVSEAVKSTNARRHLHLTNPSSSQDGSLEEDVSLRRCDAVVVMMGAQSDDTPYSKTVALHVSLTSPSICNLDPLGRLEIDETITHRHGSWAMSFHPRSSSSPRPALLWSPAQGKVRVRAWQWQHHHLS